MRGIPTVTASTLNKNVRLVGQKAVAVEERSLMLATIPFKNAYTERNFSMKDFSLYRLACANPCLIGRDMVLRDGKPCIRWETEEMIKSSLAECFVAYGSFIAEYSTAFEKHIAPYLEKITGENYMRRVQILQPVIDDLYEQMVKTAKLDKNRVSSIKDTVRALGILYFLTNTDEIIKQLNTIANKSNKILYTYETDVYIEQHYHWIAKKRSLVTCMNKGNEALFYTHFAEVDMNKVERSRAVDTIRDNGKEKNVAFTANVEGFNKSENVRLLLTSWYSPDELARSGEYDFLGRAIAYKDGNTYRYCKYYGVEQTENYLPECVHQVDHIKGAIVRGYLSAKSKIECRWGYAPRYILPYIDGTHNVFQQKSELAYDEIGRPYALFEVVDGHKYSMDGYKSDNLTDKFMLSQQDWLTTDVRYNDIVCPYTDETLSFRNSKRVGNEYVFWKIASDKPEHIEDMKSLIQSRLDYRIVEMRETERIIEKFKNALKLLGA